MLARAVLIAELLVVCLDIGNVQLGPLTLTPHSRDLCIAPTFKVSWEVYSEQPRHSWTLPASVGAYMSVQEPTSSLAADDSFGDFDGATEGPSDPQPASAEPAPAAGSSAPAATAVPAAADDDDDDFGDFDAAPTTAAQVTTSQPPAAAAAAAPAAAAPGGGPVTAAAPKPAPPPSSSGNAFHADPWKVSHYLQFLVCVPAPCLGSCINTWTLTAAAMCNANDTARTQEVIAAVRMQTTAHIQPEAGLHAGCFSRAWLEGMF